MFILLPFFLCLVVSVPFWIWLAKKCGKKNAAFWGVITLGCSTVVVYPLMPSGILLFPLINALVGGFMAGMVRLGLEIKKTTLMVDGIWYKIAKNFLRFPKIWLY